MITGTFSLIAIKDGEDATVRHIECSVAAVAVDANNVQRQAAVFSLVETAGTVSKPFSAYLRLTVLAGEVSLHQQTTGSVTEYSYTLPADRYGTATALRCEAFADEGLTEEACPPLTVAIVRENPVPFPRGEAWSADNVYKNGEYLMSGGVVYMWRNPVAGNSAVDPKTDIEQSPEATSWTAYQEWPLLATQVMLARWAKLGSAIFSGDYMFSQHGRDASGADSDQYTLFDPSKLGQAGCPFTPNVAVDWLLGKLIGLDMDIKGGKIGGFTVDGNDLVNTLKTLAARIVSEYVSGSYDLRAVLGSGVPPSTGNSSALYAHSLGAHFGRNVALMLSAKNSTWGHNLTDRKANFAAVAEGGVLWKPEAMDYWAMPGLLFACEVHINRDGSAEMVHYWGNGAGEVGFSYNASLREYYFIHEIAHADYFITGSSHFQRESGDYKSAMIGYARDTNRVTVTWWDGGNKVLPMYFMLLIFGRPADSAAEL